MSKQLEQAYLGTLQQEMEHARRCEKCNCKLSEHGPGLLCSEFVGPPRKHYKINEVIYSIQGGGLCTGKAAIFIKFSAEHDPGVLLEAQTIRVAVEQQTKIFDPRVKPIIACTGTDPNLQIDSEFFYVFRDYFLTMETNGIEWNDVMRAFHLLTVCPKRVEGWWTDWRSYVVRSHMNQGIVIKVVYDPDNPDIDALMRMALETPCAARYLQPLENKDGKTRNVKDVVQEIMRDPRWCLSLI